jgi:hypothetical protein
MAPDWEKLAKDWDNHDVGLVAEVDCTAEGRPLCDANGVKGYPSLKYGDPAGLDDYQGSRAYDDLAKFAKEHLKPVCSVANMDLCDAEKKKQIESYRKMSFVDLNAAIKAEEEKISKAEDDFKEAVSKLQAEYQKLSEEKDATVASVQSSGLGVMKSVLAAMSKDEKKDEL